MRQIDQIDLHVGVPQGPPAIAESTLVTPPERNAAPKTKPVDRNRIAPEIILRAYVDLLGRVFSFMRLRSQTLGLNPIELYALADALHNIAELLTDYGTWVDDEKFRKLYLQPFDRQWS